MDLHDLAKQAGLSIQQYIRELAEQVVACVYQRIPDIEERYGDMGCKYAIRDTEYHLTYLAESLSVDTPSLFIEYIKWNKVLFVGLHLPEAWLPITLECMRDALPRSLSQEQAKVACSYVNEALRAFPQAPSTLPSLLTAIPPPFDELARQYLERMLQRQRDEATFMILSAVNNGIDIKDIYLRVFQPVLREVGRLWQTHEISVAQEHYITAATQLVMAMLSSTILNTPKNGMRLVATCVSGELHELGARMVADFFELDGWDTYYLGANTPTESIISTIAETNADALVISATLPKHVSLVTNLIADVRAAELEKDIIILVGGYPFNTSPDLWQRIGADGYAPDAQGAVDLVNHLLVSKKTEEPHLKFKHETQPLPLPQIAVPMDNLLFDELSKLNNELVELHRELQKKNIELSQLVEQKNWFLGMASHDLRNPLAVIQGYSGLLLDESAGPLTEQQRQHLETIRNSSKLMLKLVNDLLTTVQFESGKLQLDIQPTDLLTVVRHAKEMMQISANEKRITLVVNSDPLPEMLLDPIRIGQAFQNLLSNAIKFSDPNANVEIIIRQHENEVTIAVTDHGRGIPSERLKTIFTPFSSLDKEGIAGERGTGLGLAITKRIIEAHHGHINVESEPGKGSTFTVTLPLNMLEE